MFRDLKEYQDIAKIYAEKVSKPENLEERRGSSPEQLAQNRKDAFKGVPNSPSNKRAEMSIKRRGDKKFEFNKPTGASNKRAEMSIKRREPKKPMPTTAEIRAKNPKVVPGTRVNEIGAKGGGKPSSGDLSMFKDKPAKPEVSKFTKQGKERTPAQMMAAKRIASGKTIADVKAANKASMKAKAAERFAAFKEKRAAKKVNVGTVEKKPAEARPVTQAKPAPQAQQKAAATPSGDKLKAGSFGISQKGKDQAAKNKAEVASKNNQSGGAKTVNVGGKDVDLSKVGPGMKKRLMQKNVGTNAAKEVQKVNPKPGQTVNVKQDPKTGSVSSKVTQGEGGGTENLTKSAGSLEANKKKAAKMKELEAKRNAMEKEFEIPESKQYDAYDIVLEYLLSTEQVATIEEANYVMTEMDSQTIQSVVKEFLGGEKGDGYIGHPRLGVENPFSPPKKGKDGKSINTKKTKSSTGLFKSLGNRATDIENKINNP